MKAIGTMGIALVFAALAACGGNPDSAAPAPTNPDAQQPPLVSAVGENNGAAVTQSIDAAGGTVEAMGIKVAAPAGAFANASLTLQPITDTLNAEGQGIAVSSDTPWVQNLTITFPIDPSDPNPEGWGLAVQQADGSWRAIAQVNIDVAGGTVSASLPAVTEAAASNAVTRSREAARAAPSATGKLSLKRIVKFKRFFLRPNGSTVKVNESATFVPYAQVVEKLPCGPGIPLPDCWETVTRAYPISNQLAGSQTSWYVDLAEGGSAAKGTVSPKADTGAVYTAPAVAPANGFVTVQFLGSLKFAGSELLVVAKAKVKIDGDKSPPQYNGNITVKGSDTDGNTFEGQHALTLNKTSESQGSSGEVDGQGNVIPRIDAIYQGRAIFRVTNTYAGCQPVTADLPVNVGLAMWSYYYSSTSTLPRQTRYWLSGSEDAIIFVTAQCDGGPREVQIAFGFQTQCVLATGFDGYQEFATDLSLLGGKKTLACDNGLPVTTWNMDWTLSASPPPPK